MIDAAAADLAHRLALEGLIDMARHWRTYGRAAMLGADLTNLTDLTARLQLTHSGRRCDRL